MRNKKEKIIFWVSVLLTVCSVIAYLLEAPLWLLLFSALSSYGYWLACGNTGDMTDEFFKKMKASHTDSSQNQAKG